MKKFERYTFIIAALVIAAFTSCVRDLEGGKEKSSAGDGTTLVTLSLSMPALPPATRVQGTSTENHVEEVDVLLFNTGNDNFHYRAMGTNIATDPSASSDKEKKTFTVKLPAGTYKVVVLANARAAIDALSTVLPVSTIATAPFRSRADVLDKIAFSVAGKMDDTRFPMWGDETLAIDGEPITTTIALTRAIARVDVSVADVMSPVTGTNVRDKFEISSVYLYNYSRAGSVAPLVDGAGYNLTMPHLPALADLADKTTPVKQEGPLEYTVPSTDKHAFKQAIYACEAVAGNPVTGNNWETNTCLVVGGKYTGEDGNDIDTYYRVELVNTSGVYLALERNHLYDVVIQDVNGPGWPTAALAYANKPSNIVVGITAWNEGEQNEVEFNGQHYLAVDKSRLDFYLEGYAKGITVTTDYPDGWTVDVTTLPSWLTVTAPVPTGNVASGAANQAVTLTLEAGALVAGDPDREDFFYIVAGNLRKKITVIQSNEIEFWIAITDLAGNPVTELLFEAGDASTAPVAQQFRVSWLPASISEVDISADIAASDMYGGSGSYDFGTNAAEAASPAGSGAVEFTVRPLYNSSSSARVTRVDFSITDDTRSVMLPLYLRQEKAPAAYAFSEDGKTLTLFSNFDRGANLTGLNDDNIPELQNSTIAAAVTTLVIKGNTFDLVNEGQLAGIKNARNYWAWDETETHEGLLPYLAHVSLPDFTGTIPANIFGGGYPWLKSFEALHASRVETYAFYMCRGLESVYFPEVTSIGSLAFTECRFTTLTAAHFPLLETIEHNAFLDCASLTTVDLPKAETIEAYVFYNCTSLKTLKLGYTGTIILSTNVFGWGEAVSNRANTINLFIDSSKIATEVTYDPASGKPIWQGYTWNSVNEY